jgi:predicted CDP-diglyceride synthetase/phosphatidate cytidylyltransferase
VNWWLIIKVMSDSLSLAQYMIIPFSKNYSILALADKLSVAQISMTITHYEIWKMVLFRLNSIILASIMSSIYKGVNFVNRKLFDLCQYF